MGKAEPLEYLTLKTSGAYFQESQGLWDIETPLSKRAHKISHTLGTREEAANRKEPGQTHLLILNSLSERQETEIILGYKYGHPLFWGSSVLTMPLCWLVPF